MARKKCCGDAGVRQRGSMLPRRLEYEEDYEICEEGNEDDKGAEKEKDVRG
jgi:hypothetical protein